MKTTEEKAKRIYWMDNLRTIIIFLVVLYHVGGVYESTMAILHAKPGSLSDYPTLSPHLVDQFPTGSIRHGLSHG